jgi:hypothetical protein
LVAVSEPELIEEFTALAQVEAVSINVADVARLQ